MLPHLDSGFKYVQDLLNSEPLKKYGGYFIDRKYPTRDRIAPDGDPNSDEYFDAYIRNFTRTVWHPAGSCKMGAVDDKSAVVDPHLR